MVWPNPRFTQLDLSVLETDFDKTAKAIKALPMSLDRNKKFAAAIDKCIADAVQEIDRQVAIYDKEERAYVTHIKQLHADSKVASASLVQAVASLQAKWDDNAFKAMPALQSKLHENSVSAHDWGKALTAHQAFRGDHPWLESKAVAALGAAEAEKLRKHFVAGRAPALDLTVDIKTYLVKIDEFLKRGDDCLKAVMALKTKADQIDKDFVADIKQLLADAKGKAGDCNAHAKMNVSTMQKFIVLCNQNKDVISRSDYSVAEKNLQKIDLQVKNDKTYLKTLTTGLNNLGTRTKVSPPSNAALEQMRDLSKVLQDMAADIKSMQTTRDAFVKKMADAKSASKF